MNVAVHPSQTELLDYALGRLPDNASDAVAEHVAACADCEASLAKVDGEADSLVRNIAGQPPGSVIGDSRLLAAMQAAKQFGRPAAKANPAPAPAPAAAALGRLREYELLEKLGEGGMGAVYKARHTKLDRIVALKVLKPERVQSAEAIARFEREMRAVGKLEHPHIVRAHDAGEYEGNHFLVMEYVAGADLAALVQQLGPLSVADALRCAIQAAAGLEYAHREGITHRDIKPGNLLLDTTGTVKVLDLGLARMRAEAANEAYSLSATGDVMGTVDFMPPEQAKSARSADERSDIYSLGCTLHYLLTGRPPFRGETMMERLWAHSEAPVPRLDGEIDGLPASLDEVLAKMLAKDPNERFSSMHQAAGALQQCLEQMGVSPGLAVEAAAQLPLAPRTREADPETKNLRRERSFLSTQSWTPAVEPERTVDARPSPPAAKGAGPWHRTGVAIATALALSFVAMLAAPIVLRLLTRDGTLVLEVHEPGAQVFVDDQLKTTVTSADKQRVYRIAVDEGRHRLKVKSKEGEIFYSRDFSVASGKETTLFRAVLEPIVKAPVVPPAAKPAPPADPLADRILTVAQDGSAEFKSIEEALKVVKPGLKVQVVDKADYDVQLELNLPRYEGITLEATDRATLVAKRVPGAVCIRNVRGITLRGFRIRLDSAPFGVGVIGDCSGCVLADLEVFDPSNRRPTFRGITLEWLSIPKDAEPVIVRNCRLHSLENGLRVSGQNTTVKFLSSVTTPVPCRGVLICENHFSQNGGDIVLMGAISDVVVVGNRFVESGTFAFQLEMMLADAAGNPPSRILVANNTFCSCKGSFRLWDKQVLGDTIAVRSNLILDPVGPDFMFVDTRNPLIPRAGDGKRVLDKWGFGMNWREIEPPAGTTEDEQAWIPQAKTDVLQTPLDVASTDEGDPGFLQPTAPLPPALRSAGDSKTLPHYVGAVPPPDAAKWEWKKTWDAWTKSN